MHVHKHTQQTHLFAPFGRQLVGAEVSCQTGNRKQEISADGRPETSKLTPLPQRWGSNVLPPTDARARLQKPTRRVVTRRLHLPLVSKRRRRAADKGERRGEAVRLADAASPNYTENPATLFTFTLRPAPDKPCRHSFNRHSCLSLTLSRL